MFNFLVTANEGAWDRPGYEYSRGRFLEYTSADIAAKFQELGASQIQALINLPCLFAYEGTDQPMRVGRLKRIKSREGGRLLYIEPDLDATSPSISFEDIEPLRATLDIRDWELNRTHWAIKDEDLLDILAHANLIPRSANVPTVAKEDLPPSGRPPFEAHSVSTFIEQVLNLSHDGMEAFYRGHSSRKYQLAPSVLRKDDDGDFIYLDQEARMYRELLVSNSIDFQGDVYTLDRLVRMQHYSLPTRLLDITSNPLIALYFACRSHPREEGQVIVLSVASHQIKYFDSDTASCLANLTRLPKNVKESIDYTLPDVPAFNSQSPIEQLLHFVREEKPFFESRLDPRDLQSVICVKGKHTNSRIAFQSGAFLLFGDGGSLPEEGNSDIQIQRINISEKQTILRQLDQLNINDSTVFPYIENSAKYIAAKFAFKK